VNLSQPALSKSIKALEDEYGVKLFDRHARGLVPTKYGVALEHHARRILLDLEQSKRDLAAISAGASGRVRLGVGQSLVKYAEAALSTLLQRFPGANTTVITDYAEGLKTALLENRIDIFLGMVNGLTEDKEFDIQFVAADAIVGLCHRSHEFANQTVTLPRLRGRDWLVPEHGEVARSALEAFFLLNQEPVPRIKVVTNVASVVGRFIRDFQLLSVAPTQNVEDYSNYDVARFWIRGFQFQRQVGIVQRANYDPSPLTIEFKRMLVDALGSLSQPR